MAKPVKKTAVAAETPEKPEQPEKPAEVVIEMEPEKPAEKPVEKPAPKRVAGTPKTLDLLKADVLKAETDFAVNVMRSQAHNILQENSTAKLAERLPPPGSGANVRLELPPKPRGGGGAGPDRPRARTPIPPGGDESKQHEQMSVLCTHLQYFRQKYADNADISFPVDRYTPDMPEAFLRAELQRIRSTLKVSIMRHSMQKFTADTVVPLLSVVTGLGLRMTSPERGALFQQRLPRVMGKLQDTVYHELEDPFQELAFLYADRVGDMSPWTAICAGLAMSMFASIQEIEREGRAKVPAAGQQSASGDRFSAL